MAMRTVAGWPRSSPLCTATPVWTGCCFWILWSQTCWPAGLLASAGPPRRGSPARPSSHRHRPGAAERWPIGPAPAASFWSIGDAGGASALAVVPKPSGLVDNAGSQEITPPAGFHWNMAWFQAFRTPAPLASAAWGRCPVRRPLKCVYAYGRVERWQSPVDRARLEIV